MRGAGESPATTLLVVVGERSLSIDCILLSIDTLGYLKWPTVENGPSSCRSSWAEEPGPFALLSTIFQFFSCRPQSCCSHQQEEWSWLAASLSWRRCNWPSADVTSTAPWYPTCSIGWRTGECTQVSTAPFKGTFVFYSNKNSASSAPFRCFRLEIRLSICCQLIGYESRQVQLCGCWHGPSSRGSPLCLYTEVEM